MKQLCILQKSEFYCLDDIVGTCLSFTFGAGRFHCAKFETFRVITRNLFACRGRVHEAVSISVCVYVAVSYVSTPSVLHE